MKTLFAQKALYSASPILPQAAFRSASKIRARPVPRPSEDKHLSSGEIVENFLIVELLVGTALLALRLEK
jgi:hypothetical protein